MTQSSRGKNAPSVLEKGYEHVLKYIKETTAHGWAYLDPQHHPCKRLVWAFMIITSIFTAFWMFSSFLEESRANPVITTIDTKLVTDIPFPAIGIKVKRDSVNPWGFISKVYDQYDIIQEDDPYGHDTDDSLKGKFNLFLRKALFPVVNEIEFRLRRLPLRPDLLQRRRWFDLSKEYGGFSTAVAKLGVMWSPKNSGIIQQIKIKLFEATVHALGRVTARNRSKIKRKFGNKVITPIIDAFADQLNITKQDFVICYRPETCNTYAEAYSRIMAPLIFLSNTTGTELNLGQALRHFGRLLTEDGNPLLDTPVVGSTWQLELASEIQDMTMGFLLQDNPEFQKLTINAFDMAQLVDRPSDESNRRIYQGEVSASKSDCHQDRYVESWRRFLKGQTNLRPCQNQTFMEKDSFGEGVGCCKLAEFIHRNYHKILLIMKYSLQVPFFYQTEEDYESDFSALLSLRAVKIKSDKLQRRRTFDPLILSCQLNEKPRNPNPENCNMFTQSFSNDGIAMSFNNGPFAQTFKASNTGDIFKEVMDTGFSTLASSDKQDGLVYPEAHGMAAGLQLLLRIDPHDQQKDTGGVRIGVGTPNDLIDMRSSAVIVRPGHSYTFHITPSQVTAAEPLAAMAISKRNCRFRHEADDMQFFKEFTHSRCSLECMMEKASEACGCIPWDFPQIHNQSEVCDYMGVQCFEGVMSEPVTKHDCICSFDCAKISYNFYVSSEPIDANKTCAKESPMELLLGREHYMEDQFFSLYKTTMDGQSRITNDRCRKEIKNLIAINFHLVTDVTTEIRRDVRVTLADYVSNFGGTLGLFTGMSILSIFEVFCAIVNFLFGKH